MQRKINLNGKTVLFVGLPKEASEIEFSDGCLKYYWQKYLDTNESNIWQTLPQGDWQLIGVYPELTEEMAKMVVDLPQYGCYFNYNYQNPAHKWLRTALESFQSLMEREELWTGNPWRVPYRFDQARKWQVNEAEQRTYSKWAVLIQR